MDVAPYKCIEDGLAHPCRFRSSFSFSIDGGADQHLSAGKSEYVLTGYDPAHHALALKLVVSAVDAKPLFEGDQSIAAAGSVLQAAMVWESKESGRCGVGERKFKIAQNAKIRSEELIATFPAASLRGRLTVCASLFLHKAGLGKRLPGIATQEGSELGNVWGPVTFVTEGDGALFPLIEDHEAKSSDPPWRLRMDWGADPLNTPFDKESFAICVNMKHRDAAGLLPSEDDKTALSPALREVLASSLTLFLLKVKEDRFCWDKVRRSSIEVPLGSIADAASHFLALSESRSEEPHELIASIRSSLSEKM
jgi:hypothetical protein